MQTLELSTILRYRATTPSGYHTQGSEYVIEFDADIVGVADDGREVLLGSLKFCLLRLSLALDGNADMNGIFHSCSVLDELAEELYDFDFEEFTQDIADAFDETFPHEDILLIRSVEVMPFARGQRVGLSAVHRVSKDWDSGCGLMAMDIKPLQFEFDDMNDRDDADWEKLELDRFPDDPKQASDRLQAHFGGLGFRRVGSCRFLLRSAKLRSIPVAEQDVRRSVSIPADLMDSLGRGGD